ncbi:NAD(P)/FAD-dependent oxidoreductase [Sinomicrobium soli]|uniref:NAD(P)/FAD-dependent oxidoreductase n=1 Tax=Sinomicrobium sp. N-1-3-6 TaxID=2219864 RepID=UPI000DCD3446|nr:FAD-dependent oxidoreductase [Sinomicrobium sp. N-1-3-6]RAV29678.1 FAD-dependent oxidoreductase [Sinomicrobium sp. N-1-3-6]
MTTDYIVVGLGLAGLAFCEQLRTHNRSFVVFDGTLQQSSQVAGGVYNPVVLKRFTAAWRSGEQLQEALPFYRTLEEYLSRKLVYPMPVYRRFTSAEEQNMWFEAADRPELSPFLSDELDYRPISCVDAPYGFGVVNHTGRIAVGSMIEAYRDTLGSERLRRENLDYHALSFTDEGVVYKEFRARHIVFAEGYAMTDNPLFNYLPLKGAKGEVLTIKAPDLDLENILKSSVFLIPLGSDHYLVGATYNWTDKTNAVTEEGRKELLEKLDKIIHCDYEITDQQAGIRPTVADRRPLVGRHPLQGNAYILNGLGTRGTLTGPFAARQLYRFIENDIPLDQAVDIDRFRKRYLRHSGAAR